METNIQTKTHYETPYDALNRHTNGGLNRMGGEFVGITGRCNSGRTTLMLSLARQIARLNKPIQTPQEIAAGKKPAIVIVSAESCAADIKKNFLKERIFVSGFDAIFMEREALTDLPQQLELLDQVRGYAVHLVAIDQLEQIAETKKQTIDAVTAIKAYCRSKNIILMGTFGLNNSGALLLRDHDVTSVAGKGLYSVGAELADLLTVDMYVKLTRPTGDNRSDVASVALDGKTYFTTDLWSNQ